jgi:glyoxylase-like metal-dependent hydrolase (beta-lactamase superfamily II)
MKKILTGIGLVLLLCLVAGGVYFWNMYQKYMVVHTMQISPELKIVWGGSKSGNSIVLSSKDGSSVLIVDTKVGDEALNLKKMSYTANVKDVIVVNTHAHWDHTEGNALYTNAKIIGGADNKDYWQQASKSSKYPDITLKPGEEKIITIGDEKVHIKNMGQAHSWNDVVVYLEKNKLLVTGDIVFDGVHPVLFVEGGSNTDKWITVLETLHKNYDIKTLVTGHGRVLDSTALETQKEYFVSIGNAIGNPEKLEAAKNKYKNYYSIPSLSGFDTTVKFIENERKVKPGKV